MRFDSIRSHSTAGPLDECAKFANDFPGQPEHGLTVGARDKLMPFNSDAIILSAQAMTSREAAFCLSAMTARIAAFSMSLEVGWHCSGMRRE